MKKNNIISELTIAVVILAIACAWLFIDNRTTSSFEEAEAFNRGYHNAIKSAKLIEINEDTYYIQFGDSIHEYTFD